MVTILGGLQIIADALTAAGYQAQVVPDEGGGDAGYVSTQLDEGSPCQLRLMRNQSGD